MKEKIRDDQKNYWQNEVNIKLGEGGIREIEFWVQCHQLIHGGRENQLRSAHTLTVLKNLVELGYVPERDAEELGQAYLFLRRTEDLLQAFENQQTHRLPSELRAKNKLAWLMNFTDVRSFEKKLDEHRSRVHHHFERLLAERISSTKRPGGSSRAQDVLILLHLGYGSDKCPPKTFSLFQQTANTLGEKLDHHPEWRRFMKPLEILFRRIGRQTHYYDQLNSESGFMDRLLNLLNHSDFLTETLLRDIRLLNELSVQDDVQAAITVNLDKTFSGKKSMDGEEAMDETRIFRNRKTFQIGLGDLKTQLKTLDVQHELSRLADTCIQVGAHWIERELQTRYGRPQSDGSTPPACAILGLGTLGSAEMNYKSDLDLIFIYEGSGQTDGPQIITNGEFYTLLAQRLISFLTTATRWGTAYAIDTRLRPSGRAGTLVTSRDAFSRYHQKSSQVWEIQSLLRARIIWSPEPLEKHLSKDLDQILFSKKPDAKMAGEFHQMRLRMEQERARGTSANSHRIDLKLGAGGLTDIEFICQYLQLCQGKRFHLHTFKALQKMAEGGVIEAENAEILQAAYLKYRKLGLWLCLACNKNLDSIEVGMPRLEELARTQGFDQPESLMDSLHQTAREVRKIYLKILAVSD